MSATLCFSTFTCVDSHLCPHSSLSVAAGSTHDVTIILPAAGAVATWSFTYATEGRSDLSDSSRVFVFVNLVHEQPKQSVKYPEKSVEPCLEDKSPLSHRCYLSFAHHMSAVPPTMTASTTFRTALPRPANQPLASSR